MRSIHLDERIIVDCPQRPFRRNIGLFESVPHNSLLRARMYQGLIMNAIFTHEKNLLRREGDIKKTQARFWMFLAIMF
jgi:hypothetical protein